jgi:serine/threonine protein kinase
MVSQGPSKQTEEVVVKIARSDYEGLLINEVQILRYLSGQGEPMQKYLVGSRGLYELRVDGKEALALALDYVADGDLLAHVPSAGMPEVEARPIFRQVLSAMELIHGYGVVHHDIKPSNILCERREEGLVVRLADFGVAAFLDDVGHYAEEYASGTPGFIAPELLRRSAMLSTKADCFSLGVSLYWAVTGMYPFGTDHSRETFELNLRGFTAMGAELSAELQDLLTSFGVPDPRKRLSARGALAHSWFKLPLRPAHTNAKTGHPWLKRFRRQSA